MITLIVVANLFIVYVVFIFFRGMSREKKSRKRKKVPDDLADQEEINLLKKSYEKQN